MVALPICIGILVYKCIFNGLRLKSVWNKCEKFRDEGAADM